MDESAPADHRGTSESVRGGVETEVIQSGECAILDSTFSIGREHAAPEIIADEPAIPHRRSPTRLQPTIGHRKSFQHRRMPRPSIGPDHMVSVAEADQARPQTPRLVQYATDRDSLAESVDRFPLLVATRRKLDDVAVLRGLDRGIDAGVAAAVGADRDRVGVGEGRDGRDGGRQQSGHGRSRVHVVLRKGGFVRDRTGVTFSAKKRAVPPARKTNNRENARQQAFRPASQGSGSIRSDPHSGQVPDAPLS